MEENNQNSTINLNNMVGNTNLGNVVGVEPNIPNYGNVYNQTFNNNVPPTYMAQPVQSPVESAIVQVNEPSIVNVQPQGVTTAVDNSQGITINQQPTQTVVTEPVQPAIEQPVQQVNAVYEQPVAPQNSVPNTPEQQPVENVVPEQPIVTDKFKVRTVVLKQLIANAKKAAICEKLLPTTTVIQLEFNEEGFTTTATDSANIIRQVDKNVKYTNSLKLCVSAELISKLVTKLDDDPTQFVEFIYDNNSRVVDLVAGTSNFKIKEIYDQSTFEPIVIPTEGLEYNNSDEVYKFNIDSWREEVIKAKSFMANPAVTDVLAGVYCADKIYSTNQTVVFGSGIVNTPISNTPILLSDRFVNLFTSCNITGDVDFVIRRNADTKEPQAIIINSNLATIGGPVHFRQGEYPTEIVNKFLATSYPNTVKFTKAPVVNALDIALLFVDPTTDKGNCSLELMGDKVVVTSLDGTATQSLPIETETPINNYKVQLDVKSFSAMLNNIKESSVTIKVDPNNTGSISVLTEKDIQVISTNAM